MENLIGWIILAADLIGIFTGNNTVSLIIGILATLVNIGLLIIWFQDIRCSFSLFRAIIVALLWVIVFILGYGISTLIMYKGFASRPLFETLGKCLCAGCLASQSVVGLLLQKWDII